jgi:TPR repeat protein
MSKNKIKDYFIQAVKLDVAGQYVRSRDLLNKCIEEMDDVNRVAVCHMLVAIRNEQGRYGCPDLLKAAQDYRLSMAGVPSVRQFGVVGAARVLYKLDMKRYFNDIRVLCLSAYSEFGDRSACMLLGYAFQFAVNDANAARLWYRRAFLRGSKWALGRLAVINYRNGRPLPGVVLNIVNYAVRPVFSIFDRSTDPFIGRFSSPIFD